MADGRLAVILDTDIGSDIDDAVALGYLLKQPRCELVGVTTVSGSNRQRAMLADAVCRAGGRDDVPIHCGPDASLLRGLTQPECPQAEVLERWPHRDDFVPGEAIEWMRHVIRQRPGDIHLLSVGPLTNIGLLFATDPEIPGLLASYSLMGGRYLPGEAPGGWTEWNTDRDPEASAIVFQRAPAGLRGVGLDVTLKCRLAAETCRERFARAGGALGAVAEMAEVWFRGRPEITFHDPLAAAALFAPDLITWRRGRVTVDWHSPSLAGVTVFRGDREGPHEVAATVDPERFFEHYFAVVGG